MRILATLLMMTTPVAMVATQNIQAEQSASHAHVKASELKSWFDQGKEMVVLDARDAEYFDHNVIAGAKWVPYNASDAQIKAALPSKDTLVITYCWSLKCPLSKKLADRLSAAGYKNVMEFSEGLEVWREKGYPTSKK